MVWTGWFEDANGPVRHLLAVLGAAMVYWQFGTQ